MKSTLEAAIKANGLETDIRNLIFHLIRSTIKHEIKSALQPVSSYGKNSFRKYDL